MSGGQARIVGQGTGSFGHTRQLDRLGEQIRLHVSSATPTPFPNQLWAPKKPASVDPGEDPPLHERGATALGIPLPGRRQLTRADGQTIVRGSGACPGVGINLELPLPVTPDASPLPTLESSRLLARAAFDVAVGHRALPTWHVGPIGK